MRKLLLILLYSSLLSGCAGNQITTYGKVDKLEKTALIDPGTQGVLGVLKERLINEGWVLVVSRGDGKVRGRVMPEVDLTETKERSPRYQFIVTQHIYDICLTGGDAVDYEVVVVDAKKGVEVSSIKGRGCIALSGEDFTRAIRNL